jgi:hypothetical protein
MTGDKEKIVHLIKDHVGSDEPSAATIAKEIRARVADLNELNELAIKRGILVRYEVLESEEHEGIAEHINVQVSVLV